MTDKIIVLKNCLIKLSNFRNVKFVERGKSVNPEKSLCWRKIRPGWLFNFKQWCESMPAVIGHYPWSIRTYRYMYMDEVMENLFSLYCSTWHAVSKMFVRFFQIKQVKASKKVEQELFILILFWSLYKTKRFHFAVGLFSNSSQMTSKCGKNISDTLTCGSRVTSLFLPHFDVICDLLLNRCMATWNLFVKHNGAIGLPSKNIASVMLTNLVFSVFSEKCQLLAKGRSWRKIVF